MRRTSVITALGMASIFATVLSPLAAQSANALKPGVLRLVVVDDRDLPVGAADVTVQMGQLRARGRTDNLGSLRIDGIAPGNWEATVRRIGFNQAILALSVAEGENVFTLSLDPNIELLKEVKVIEKLSTTGRLGDFERRRESGDPNAVITRAEIVKRNPMYLSQMLRGIPGLTVSDQQGIKVPVASRSMVPKLLSGTSQSAPQVPQMGPCPMRVGVDGIMRAPMSSLDDIAPSEVHGVEIYYGPARLPLQLSNLRTDNWCGLVMIWTRAN